MNNKKTIIHNRIPIESVRSALTTKTVQDIHNSIKNLLGDDYTVITTPTELSVVDGDAVIITIDCKEYSYNELKAIIESR